MTMSSPLLSWMASAFWFSWHGPWQNSVRVIRVWTTSEKSGQENGGENGAGRGSHQPTVLADFPEHAQAALGAPTDAVEETKRFGHQIVIGPISLNAQEILNVRMGAEEGRGRRGETTGNGPCPADVNPNDGTGPNWRDAKLMYIEKKIFFCANIKRI